MGGIVSRSGGPTIGYLAALAGCCIGFAAAPGASAQTTTGASVRPSLLPNRLGASTALTLAFRFSGGEEGVPAPLSGMVVRLPAGLTINLRGAGICAKSQLQRRGAAGCPSSSLVGRGHGLNDVHAGSLTVPEEVTISVFRGPNRGSRPTLQIFSQGETPLDQSSISSAVLEPDGAPYGSKLTMSVPPIPTLDARAERVVRLPFADHRRDRARSPGARRRRRRPRAAQLSRRRLPVRRELHVRRPLRRERFGHRRLPVSPRAIPCRPWKRSSPSSRSRSAWS